MANITPRKNKNGVITSYTIRVLRGRDENGKQIFSTRSYPDKKRGEFIPTGWSQKKIEKEVERIATLFEEECRVGNVATRRVRFKDFVKEYLEAMSVNGMKNSTLVSYEGYMERVNDMNLDGIGHLELDKITTQHINNFITALASPKKMKRPLSPKTRQNYLGFISSVMTYACSNNIIKTNPCQYAIKPKKNENEGEVEIIQKDDIGNVLIAIDSMKPNWRLFTYLTFATGARLGEVLGLQYCDFDFETNTVHFHNNLQYRKMYGSDHRELYIETIKNKQQRKVILPTHILNVLKDYAVLNNIENLESEQFVFAGTANPELPMYPSAVKRAFDRFNEMVIIKKWQRIEFYNHHTHCDDFVELNINDVVFYKGYADEKKTKLKVVIGDIRYLNFVEVAVEDVAFLPKKIHPHEFRHTLASMMNYNEIDMVTISKTLGHTQVSTTANIYSHLFAKVDDRSAKITGNLIESNV